jgi:hypothetical protein
MSSKRNRRRSGALSDLILPPPERSQHGLIELMDKTIADEQGRPSRPYKSVDILIRMERRGSITPGMRQAGEDFRNAFRRACSDPLAATDLSRPFIDSVTGRKPSSIGAVGSSDKVRRAILSVGGMGSAGGSCLWHVVGWERTLKEWAFEQGWNGRRVSQEAAYGILIATLGTLEGHFGRVER